MQPKADPGIEWIREVRHKISEEHHHDSKELVSYYIELQKKYQERLLETPGEETQPSELVNT
jgi:hypothetical protein